MGLDKLQIKSGTQWNVEININVALFSIDATNRLPMRRDVILNKYVFAGARSIGAYNNINAGNDIICKL